MSGRDLASGVIPEKLCPVCGRRYILRCKSEWAYVSCRGLTHQIFFCSWKCMRRHEKEAEERKEARRQKQLNQTRISTEKQREVMLLVRRGLGAGEIAELAGITKRKAQYYMKREGR